MESGNELYYKIKKNFYDYTQKLSGNVNNNCTDPVVL